MAKIIDCNKVRPAGDCSHVVRGETEEELFRNAAEHAKAHGLELTPELLAKVREFIEDEVAA